MPLVRPRLLTEQQQIFSTVNAVLAQGPQFDLLAALKGMRLGEKEQLLAIVIRIRHGDAGLLAVNRDADALVPRAVVEDKSRIEVAARRNGCDDAAAGRFALRRPGAIFGDIFDEAIELALEDGQHNILLVLADSSNHVEAPCGLYVTARLPLRAARSQ